MEHSRFPIFLDANIPMYAAGRAHPLREPCLRILEIVDQHREAFVTDAEVLQELLHRYVGAGDPSGAQDAVEKFAGLMAGRVEPLLGADVERAAELATEHPRLSARDLVHRAVLRRLGVGRFASADHGFDGIAWLARLDPLALDAWADTVLGA